MKAVTWRSWAVIVAVCAVYAMCGYRFANNGTVEMWIYRTGLTALTFAAPGTVLLWTLSGQKWWRNDLGTGVVRLLLALIPFSGPLAWVFWFQGGVARPGTISWLLVSGPAASSLAMAAVVISVIRAHRGDDYETYDHDVQESRKSERED